MTADAAHVAAVGALLNTVCSCENREDEFAFLGCTHCDATVAVETLTPLIRAQVAAEIQAERARCTPTASTPADSYWLDGLDVAARIAEGTR